MYLLLVSYSVQPIENAKFDVIERTVSEVKKSQNYLSRLYQILKHMVASLKVQIKH